VAREKFAAESLVNLREEINDLVCEFLEHGAQTDRSVDVVALTTEMAQSVIDIVMAQDEANQAPLLACIMTTLGNEYLQRRGLMSERRGH
jgi:hypothetical protein